MDFFKKRARQISNVLVVIAVVIAIYIKWTGDGSDAFFKEYDVYIIGGIALGFIVLSFLKKAKKNYPKRQFLCYNSRR